MVRQGSLDLSAGSIETRDEQVRIRTIGRNYEQQDFESIVVIGRSDGTVVRLGDIATVIDGFEDTDLITSYNGQPAALVEVYRTSDERVLEIVDVVEAVLAEDIIPGLPEGVSLEVWNNDADLLADRLQLMLKNAALGLVLVLFALMLFLELGLAAWVAAGIAMSFIGTLAVMIVLGVSINIMSLQAFILAIGIVVDDAIVVGENIYGERERGVPGLLAAVRGAKRITGPVIFAVLTTITAFSPLLFVPGPLGKMMGAIPIIVISVLVLSLIESLLILPHHLSRLPEPHAQGKTGIHPSDHANPGVRGHGATGLHPGATGAGAPVRHEGARYHRRGGGGDDHSVRCAHTRGADSGRVPSLGGGRQRDRRPRDAGGHLGRTYASGG